ncbi:hypothetical protein AB0O90_17045 [Microbacterium testaceum]|uniref:hypothetical protein n=1 Tax=Microbacterium testaceum TaxID=2033 RepID=UPI003418CAE5
MSAVTFVTVQTTLPARDDQHTDLLRKVAQRDQELYDYGRNGYRLTSTVTVTGTELVTVIDTLTKEES